jgi:hypothetical protein
MKRVRVILCACIVGSALSACGPILGSAGGKLPGSDTDRPLPKSGGSAYSLPRAVLDVKLTDIAGDLVLTIGQPEYVPDEHYTYLLQYKPSMLASDTAELTIDPKTNLLQTVNGTAEDKTSQVVVQLAEAAAMLAQAATAEEGIVIFERKIDPANDGARDALVRDMNRIATGHAAEMHATNCTNIDKKDKDKAGVCARYDALREGTKISFTVGKPDPLNVEPVDCSVGICYRAPAPYSIDFDFNGKYAYGTVVNLPNERPALALPLERTLFVKRVDNAEFENGMLKKAHFEKPSEALEVASLPATVMTGIFTSISNLIQAKIDLSDKEKGLAQSETALLQAQKDLQDKRVATQQSAREKQPTTLLSGSSSGRLIKAPLSRITSPPALTSTAPPPGLISPSTPGQLPAEGKR